MSETIGKSQNEDTTQRLGYYEGIGETLELQCDSNLKYKVAIYYAGSGSCKLIYEGDDGTFANLCFVKEVSNLLASIFAEGMKEYPTYK